MYYLKKNYYIILNRTRTKLIIYETIREKCGFPMESDYNYKYIRRLNILHPHIEILKKLKYSR